MNTDAKRLIRAIEAGLLAIPGMRVGQLLDNAMAVAEPPILADLFNVTDERLAVAVEQYVGSVKQPPAPKERR